MCKGFLSCLADTSARAWSVCMCMISIKTRWEWELSPWAQISRAQRVILMNMCLLKIAVNSRGWVEFIHFYTQDPVPTEKRLWGTYNHTLYLDLYHSCPLTPFGCHTNFQLHFTRTDFYLYLCYMISYTVKSDYYSWHSTSSFSFVNRRSHLKKVNIQIYIYIKKYTNISKLRKTQEKWTFTCWIKMIQTHI